LGCCLEFGGVSRVWVSVSSLVQYLGFGGMSRVQCVLHAVQCPVLRKQVAQASGHYVSRFRPQGIMFQGFVAWGPRAEGLEEDRGIKVRG